MPRRSRLVLLLALLLSPLARADEGLWLFTNPPRQQLQDQYHFTPTQPWLDHLMRSAVRFNSGGSGSFVSADGLVMTNHHVAADALQKLSTEGRDLIAAGFLARTRAEELKCLDLELNVLVSIEDVTARVNAAVKPDMPLADAHAARRAVMNTIEQESLEKTHLRSDVVTLYQGGQYHLYRYKKYTDVRLVFAPEKDIAFFGGDPDNFEYPRFDLDVAFFRAYDENGKPAKVEHHLQWSASGPADGELIFVAGHPGKTNRGDTIADVEFARDLHIPAQLDRHRRAEVLLRTYADRDAENARRAQDELFGVQNTRKLRLGLLAGLQDPAFLAPKRDAEAKLRASAAASHAGSKPSTTSAGKLDPDPWEQIATSLAVNRRIYTDLGLYHFANAFDAAQFWIARTLVRLADESAKPNGDRLREYRQSNRESLLLDLFSDAPIYDDLETLKLADSLSYLLEQKGPADPLVRQILAGKSPRSRAAELISNTRLSDVAERKRLASLPAAELAKSADPMIQLARLADPKSRELRTVYEQQIEEPQRQAYAKIAALRFAALGDREYPDATFTLRLSFGAVRGYDQPASLGGPVPPFTTFAGLYDRAARHRNADPFHLPDRWTARKSALDPNTPFNFITTADIIGGNSGSPVVNRAGQLVGLIFDGNLPSLSLDYAYSDTTARSVAVHSQAILESLRKIYDAAELADELQPPR